MMHVVWIEDGKKFTIVSVAMIVLGTFIALTTNDVKIAYGMGITSTLFGFIAVKSAIGWSWNRAAQKRWKAERRYN